MGKPFHDKLKDFKYEDTIASNVEKGSDNLVSPVDKLLSFSVDKWIKYADQLDPYRRLSFTRETEKELKMPDKLLDDLDTEEREIKEGKIHHNFLALGDNNKEIGKLEMSTTDPSYQIDYSQCKCMKMKSNKNNS